MSSWVKNLLKEARRYRPGDSVRVFTTPRKGKGKNLIVTPNFERGKILGWDPETRMYDIETSRGKIKVRPRNISHDSRQ